MSLSSYDAAGQGGGFGMGVGYGQKGDMYNNITCIKY
jgi:hypothetical protein